MRRDVSRHQTGVQSSHPAAGEVIGSLFENSISQPFTASICFAALLALSEIIHLIVRHRFCERGRYFIKTCQGCLISQHLLRQHHEHFAQDSAEAPVESSRHLYQVVDALSINLSNASHNFQKR